MRRRVVGVESVFVPAAALLPPGSPATSIGVGLDGRLNVLEFTAPEAERASLLTVDAWPWERGRQGGRGVTRGVVIAPARAAAVPPSHAPGGSPGVVGVTGLEPVTSCM